MSKCNIVDLLVSEVVPNLQIRCMNILVIQGNVVIVARQVMVVVQSHQTRFINI
jgi:hypothetical protein